MVKWIIKKFFSAEVNHQVTKKLLNIVTTKTRTHANNQLIRELVDCLDTKLLSISLENNEDIIINNDIN